MGDSGNNGNFFNCESPQHNMFCGLCSLGDRDISLFVFQSTILVQTEHFRQLLDVLTGTHDSLTMNPGYCDHPLPAPLVLPAGRHFQLNIKLLDGLLRNLVHAFVSPSPSIKTHHHVTIFIVPGLKLTTKYLQS